MCDLWSPIYLYWLRHIGGANAQYELGWAADTRQKFNTDTRVENKVNNVKFDVQW